MIFFLPHLNRKDVAEYCRSVRGLVLRLLEAISESLGLERDFIDKKLGSHGQHMAMNYYPPCPQPELTYGLPGHTDPNLITILLQDDVPGLQVLRNGKWIAVNPIPNTFIVNIGDQIQVNFSVLRCFLHKTVKRSYFIFQLIIQHELYKAIKNLFSSSYSNYFIMIRFLAMIATRA